MIYIFENIDLEEDRLLKRVVVLSKAQAGDCSHLAPVRIKLLRVS